MAQYGVGYRPWAGEAWPGFDELRREMDALFGRFGGGAASRRGVFPAANLYETENAYVLTAELPGLTSDEIEVSIEGKTVTIGGERRIERGAETGAHRLERQSGRFRRAFELPDAVDPTKIEAVHHNGVLMLRLPKEPEHQPRQISVQAG